MSENLPMKVDNTFLGKTKRFFRKLFGHYNKKEIPSTQDITETNNSLQDSEKKSNSDNVQEVSNNNINEEQKENAQEQGFVDSIKVAPKTKTENEKIQEEKRERLLDKVDANLDIIHNLPQDKIEKIKQLYIESISNYDQEIKMLKQN